MKTRRRFTKLLFFPCLLACSRGGAPEAKPPQQSVRQLLSSIGQSCPMPQSSQAASRVMMEIAEIETSSLLLDGGLARNGTPEGRTALDESSVTVSRVLSLTANHATPATVAMDVVQRPNSAAACPAQKELWDLTVTPTLGAHGSGSVALAIVLEPAPPLGQSKASWHIPEHRRIVSTVVVRDQQKVSLGVGPGRMLVVTPYLIRDESDVRQLFSCKMRARTAAFPTPGAGLEVPPEDPSPVTRQRGRRWKN